MKVQQYVHKIVCRGGNNSRSSGVPNSGTGRLATNNTLTIHSPLQ
jgi:hypothetical protein